MLPKLKLRHQSIMHDYMFGSARKAHQIKAKTFKWVIQIYKIYNDYYFYFPLFIIILSKIVC